MELTDLPARHFGAILADPPWQYRTFSRREETVTRGKRWGLAESQYPTMSIEDICAMPVRQLAADNCVLFLWVTWPNLVDSLRVIESWGFEYKTCAFDWMKAHAGQLEMFRDDIVAYMGLGYWTRSNTEPCLLAVRGKPKRLRADVRMGIIAPRRQHSRKPDGVHERIEQLVTGPYLELFARTERPGWRCWGNETDKFRVVSAQ